MGRDIARATDRRSRDARRAVIGPLHTMSAREGVESGELVESSGERRAEGSVLRSTRK